MQAQIEVIGSEEYGRLFDVQYHPTEPDRLYALTLKNHIVTSKDNGETWDILYSVENAGSVCKDLKFIPVDNSLSFYQGNTLYILDLETMQISLETSLPITPGADRSFVSSYYIYPSDKDIIIASQGITGLDDDDITFSKAFYTTDGGQDWEEIYFSQDNDKVKLNSVAINPDEPDKLYLFRSNGSDDINGGVFISDDAGQTWEEKLTGYTLDAFDFNPDNSDELLVGTSIGFGSHEEKLYKSTDAGDTWDSIPVEWTDKTLNNITHIAYKPTDPNTVMVLEENEIVVTEDGFATWENYVYPEVDVHNYYYGLHTSFNPFQEGELYISSNYHVLFSDDQGENLEWNKNPYFSTTGQNTNVFQSDAEQHLYYGVQFGYVHKDLNSEEEEDYYTKPLDFVSISPNTPMHIDEQIAGRVYAYESSLTGSELKVSLDHGEDEAVIYNTMKTNFNAVTSYPSDDKVILVSLSNQESAPELIKIDYSNIDDVEVNILDLPIESWVSGIYINDDFILITIGDSLYKSFDDGESWEEITEGLEELSSGNNLIYDLASNTLDDNQMSIATTQGLFTSYDQGSTWEKIKSGYFNKVEHSIYTNGQLVATTYTQITPTYEQLNYTLAYTNDFGDTWEEINYDDIFYIYSATSATLFNEDGETGDVYIGTSDLGLLKLTIDFNSLGVPDYSENDENKVIVYPNPVDNELQIDLQNNGQVKNLKVFNIQGQKVSEAQGIDKINVASLPTGIYLIHINTDSNKKIVKRFIKK